MKKIILIEYGGSKKLGAALKVCQPTVRKALRFKKNDALGEKIRNVAIKEYNGKIVEIPDYLTWKEQTGLADRSDIDDKTLHKIYEAIDEKDR